MSERPKTLAEIQEECRRFAAEIGIPDVARILSRAADDLERLVFERKKALLWPVDPDLFWFMV
jgi:hypothetical protein